MMNALSLILPMTISFQFDIAGGLFLAELVLPTFAIFYVIFNTKIEIDPNFKTILFVGMIYLMCFLLS